MRHSKHAGVMGSEALTYHERKALGHGTVDERLGKDSLPNYYDCRLSLQPVVDPMVTPEGHLYSKEAIFENLLQQKKAIKRKMAEWEAEQQQQQALEAEKEAVAEEARLIAFDRQNHMGISERTAKSIQTAIQQEAEAMHSERGARNVVAIKEHEGRMKQMKAFWLPSQVQGTKAPAPKPDTHTICPASGKPLKLKDLVPVRFTPVPEGETGRYMDPVTKDTFTNASKLVVLKPTGDVMLEATYKACVAPEGRYEGVRVREKDVIKLQGGGTGFAAHDGDRVKAKKFFHLGPGSGRADLRGQHVQGRSYAGLAFNN